MRRRRQHLEIEVTLLPGRLPHRVFILTDSITGWRRQTGCYRIQGRLIPALRWVMDGFRASGLAVKTGARGIDREIMSMLGI